MDDENIAPVLLTVILAGGLHYLEIQAAIFCKCCGKYLPCYNWLMHKKLSRKLRLAQSVFLLAGCVLKRASVCPDNKIRATCANGRDSF